MIERPEELLSVRTALEKEFSGRSAEIIYKTICEELNDAKTQL